MLGVVGWLSWRLLDTVRVTDATWEEGIVVVLGARGNGRYRCEGGDGGCRGGEVIGLLMLGLRDACILTLIGPPLASSSYSHPARSALDCNVNGVSFLTIFYRHRNCKPCSCVPALASATIPPPSTDLLVIAICTSTTISIAANNSHH